MSVESERASAHSRTDLSLLREIEWRCDFMLSVLPHDVLQELSESTLSRRACIAVSEGCAM